MRIPLTVAAGAALAALLVVMLAAHSCVEERDRRDAAEASLSVAEAQRRAADAAAETSREALAQTTRDMLDQEERAKKIVDSALRSRAAAEARLSAAQEETARLVDELAVHRSAVLALPPGEVAERLSAAYPGDVAPLPDGDGVQATSAGARAILADLQERIDLRAVTASQREEIRSCGLALDSSRAAGLGYMQETDAYRRRLEAAELALSHTEASRVAAQAEIAAILARPRPSYLRRYLIAAGAGAAAALILSR